MTQIRPATPGDIPALLALWNPVIRNTTVTFSSEEKTAETLSAMIAERRAAGWEVFVADTGGVTGFATYSQFRGGNGYVHAMEHSILLAPGACGKGIGRALMMRVEDHARQGGAHLLVAGVSGENTAGIAFHDRIGFATAGRIPQVGRKFGRWLDLILMTKFL